MNEAEFELVKVIGLVKGHIGTEACWNCNCGGECLKFTKAIKLMDACLEKIRTIDKKEVIKLNESEEDEEKLKLVKAIGRDVCEDCEEGSDCGVESEECFRIRGAIETLNDYLKEREK